MKYEVKKEFLLTTNEAEIEKLATAVKNHITAVAKEVAESGELIFCSNPAKEFIEVKAGEWFDLLDQLVLAIGTVKWANEHDFTTEVVHRIFEEDRKRREKTNPF